MTDSVWTRARAANPPKETLSRAQIVRAALDLLDADGVAGLSMRKLATRLDAGATSLYWHVQTKQDLLELVIDEVYGEVDVPDPELAGWRAGAMLFGHSLRSTVLRHPWLPEVIYTMPSIGPNAVSLGSRGLKLFGAAGFEGLDIDLAMGSVLNYVLGAASSEAVWQVSVRKSGKTEDEWVGELLQLAETATEGHPEMHESVRRRDMDQGKLQDQSFVFGLDALLNGLEARLVSRTSDSGHSDAGPAQPGVWSAQDQ